MFTARTACGSASPCDVLVLEDMFLVRHAEVALLEEAGFSVMEAANSTAALAALEQVRCRILLADIILGSDSPIPDGRDVAAEALRLYPELAVIYTSSRPVEFGRPLTARERVVLKPAMSDRLIHAINELLQLEPTRMLAG